MARNFHTLLSVSLFLGVCTPSNAAIPTLPSIPWTKPTPLHAVKDDAPSTVSCAQAYAVAKWAHSKFGGPKPSHFTSEAYATKVARALVEKWDPYHVLHTRSDVQKLEKSFVAGWKKFSKQRSCLNLVETIDTHVAGIQKRLAETTKQISLQEVLPTTFRNSERHNDTQMIRYRYYPVKAETLAQRIRDEVKLSLKDLTIRTWEAYGKDGKKLVASVVENRMALDSDRSSTHWLLLASMGALDPYSTYLTDQEFEELTQDLSGVASGIGIRLRVVPSGLLIREVLPDSPAGKSGELAEGDIILEVDGKKLEPLAYRRKQESLRGAAGEPVTLKISRKDEGEKIVKLSRQEITLEDAKVSYHFFPVRGGEQDIAILRVPSFYAESSWNFHGDNKSCALDVERALMEISKRKRKIAALVLDLRGNPGGFLEEAVSMAGLFLGNQPVVGVANGENVKILRNYHRKPLYSGPLVVALDPDSASASEVLAGALRDNGRAVVVAEGHSYGKGSVQRLFPLRDVLDSELPLPKIAKVGAIKLTTSLFFSPKGVSPEGTGVEPDILVGEKPKLTQSAYKLRKVYEAALATSDSADAVTPTLTTSTLKDLETKSRSRNKSTQESLSKALTKLMEEAVDSEVSPGLVEAVAVARDFDGPAVAAKN